MTDEDFHIVVHHQTNILIANLQDVYDREGDPDNSHRHVYGGYCVFITALHALANAGETREDLLRRVNANFDVREAHMQERGS